MNVERQDFYPGELASAQETLDLANEYRGAAETLWPTGEKLAANLRAPYRLLGIHSVELYLNALLRFGGLATPQIRGLQHNLADRSARMREHGVVLRNRTLKHLETLTVSREYLHVRYDSERRVKMTELNALAATLNDVARKVMTRMERG
jgi:hypothetical protein